MNPTPANPWGIRFMRMLDMSNDSHLFHDNPGEGLLPLYEAKMIHQFDHRWATYEPVPLPFGNGTGSDVNSRDCTDAEKSNPHYQPEPRYWVAEKEVLARIATVPRGLANAWLAGDGDKLMTETGLWVIGHLRQTVGDAAFLQAMNKLNPELAQAALKAKTRWEKPKMDANATPIPEALFECLGKVRGMSALSALFDEWMDTLSPCWLMGWRDITNATNERTVIASVMPRVGVGNQMPVMLFESNNESKQLAVLLGNLLSLTFDFVARHKIGGTHLNYFIYKQLPVLPPNHYTETDHAFIVPRVLELTYTAHDLKPWADEVGAALVAQGVVKPPLHPYPWNPNRRALLRAELDAWYARAYGLTRDELRYILDPADVMGSDYPSETFRVLKNNELREFGEYRTRRLVLEAWDRINQPFENNI